MKNIHLFIEHVVNNWSTTLKEAFAPAVKQQLLDKFKQEADDLNQQISDEQLGRWIDRFDQIKSSDKIIEKDLFKYTFNELRRLVTRSPIPGEEDEREDDTPDVVYDDNGIIIWNGSKEGNCITYGRGEKWCITRGSFSNYRYSQERRYPTFYLAKNNNLPSDDKLSFVAIQVRDTYGNQAYVYTNRKNTPNESNPMGFDSLLREIPWLRDIPNIQNILRYIPLSPTEKATQVYGKSPIGVREWIKLPFNTKKQYLVVRKNKGLFSDISEEKFIQKYLCKNCDPNYPEISKFISVTPGVIEASTLLQNIEYFSNSEQSSILKNLQSKIDTDTLTSDSVSFDLKKILVYKGAFELASDERLYVTDDKNTIVQLIFDDNTVRISTYTKYDDNYNIKLNKNSVKYITDYPEIDKIPFRLSLELLRNGVVDSTFIDKVITKSKEDPNSNIVTQELEDGSQIIIDGNSFKAYVKEGDNIVSMPFNNEKVKAALDASEDNNSLGKAAYNLIKNGRDAPSNIEKESFFTLLKNLPYSERTGFQTENVNGTVVNNLVLMVGERLFWVPTNEVVLDPIISLGYNADRWFMFDRNEPLTDLDWAAYFQYLRSRNLSYTDNNLEEFLNNVSRGSRGAVSTLAFIRSNPPVNPANRYRIATIPRDGEEVVVLVNVNSPQDSKAMGKRGSLVRANINPAVARRILGIAEPAAPAATPRTTPTTPRATPTPAPAAQAPAGDNVNANVVAYIEEAGLTDSVNALPPALRNRILTGQVVAADNGVANRNRALQGIGRVTRIIANGSSRMYIIALNNGVIAQASFQPEARHFILTRNPNNRVVDMRRVSNFRPTLDNLLARNIVQENKITLKTNKMKIQDLKRIIKEELTKILAEAGTAPAPVKPTTKPGTGRPSPLTPPKDAPKTRPKAKDKKEEVKETKEEMLVKGIMNKYKKLKK
jgi:hypothetical protein